MAKNKFLRLISVLVCCFCLTTPVFAANTRTKNYTYDFWGVVSRSIPAFELTRTIDGETMPNAPLSSVDDVAAGGGRVFVVDSQESRLNVFDESMEFVISIKLLRNEDNKIALMDDGSQLILTNPEGVWFHEKGNEIYIADTGAERILVLDGDGYFIKRIITRPENMIGVTRFAPSKITVDNADRIYIVVQAGYEGIIELTKSGDFSRYVGVNKPTVDFWDYFWKQFASEAQREKMAKQFAPSFNNLTIDKDGFIFATTYDMAAQDMVFRLNPKGENVLLNNGYFPVRGDSILPMGNNIQTAFIDIAVSDYGVYAVLDSARGRIFVYDFDGNLLNIFGSNGNLKGDFRNPVALAWFDDKIIVGDKALKCAYVFELTDFGEAALGATKHYYNGEWEQSAEMFKKSLELNANFDLAYVGIGKYYLMNDDFENAMYYFKLGQDRTFYSKAYNGYRNLWVMNNFIWILLVIAVTVAGIVYSEYKYHKKGAGGNVKA